MPPPGRDADMPRGGRRQGTQGARYANRADLQQGPRPITRIPGQPYGAQSEQVALQRAVQPAPVGPSAAPAAVGAATSGASGLPAATQPVPLSAPTARPNEPVTAGIDLGAGPGAPTTAPIDVNDLLSVMARSTPEAAQLYDYLARGGQ